MTKRSLRLPLLVAGAALLLIACGGGGVGVGGAPAADAIESASAPPPAAAASFQGLADFIVALSTAAVDQRDAFDLTSLEGLSAEGDALEPVRTPVDR